MLTGKLIRNMLWTMVAVLMAASCAMKENTAQSRAWKAFTARYNTYFNGHQAYLNGYKAKVDGNKDNYTDYLPLLLVGNQASRTIGKGDFETAVTKMEKTIQLHSIKKKPERKRGHKMSAKEKKFRERQEFNPFLKNAWMLMGYAQLQKGEFIEAASTFSYIEMLYRTQPEITPRGPTDPAEPEENEEGKKTERDPHRQDPVENTVELFGVYRAGGRTDMDQGEKNRLCQDGKSRRGDIPEDSAR